MTDATFEEINAQSQLPEDVALKLRNDGFAVIPGPAMPSVLVASVLLPFLIHVRRILWLDHRVS